MGIQYHNGQNLQSRNFSSQQLNSAVFTKSDLRSTNFRNAQLQNASFVDCKFGIKPSYYILIFLIATILSFSSGYMAMLSGTTLQALLQANNEYLRLAGYIISGLCAVAIATALKMGLTPKSLRIFIVLIVFVATIGLITSIWQIAGAGIGAIYGLATLMLLLLMFIIGSIGRSMAGTLGSTIIFIVVAMGGGMFGKSLGGGIGTVIMAISSALISKKALNSKEPSLLKTIALFISTRFGTSFKDANISAATFSNSKIKNTDFAQANMEGIIMDNAEEQFCYRGK